MKLTRVGVDLAKQVFQVHGVDRAERPVWCQRLKRSFWRRIIFYSHSIVAGGFPEMS
jgi:transposase